MPSNFTTNFRSFRLKLAEYEEDDLLIEEMAGHEGMSQLFEFQLRLRSHSDAIDPRKIIGKPADLQIETSSTDHNGGVRHWNGFVSRFKRTGRAMSADGQDVYTYECDIVPWFWFMTQNEDNRIFQNKTVREIIEIIFDEFQYSDFDFNLTESHPALEYCTQYHETTFEFISRLIEREGIHYYFKHQVKRGEPRHILMFTDNNGGNPKLDPDSHPYHHAGYGEHGAEAILSLSMDQQMRTRRITLSDWDYEKKNTVQEDTPTLLDIGSDHGLERYRYPGGFVESNLGKYRSRVIMEAEEASHMCFFGRSQIRTLVPGHVFRLEDHPLDEFNIDYMVLSVWHHGRNNMTDSAAKYGNEIALQPKQVTWRAPLRTPRACVRGPQTALVVGPPSEEIYTDQLGRIKVRFHWDRKVDKRRTDMPDDKATCWIRVAQMWAGNGYGTMFVPRIGMEVIVDFLEGDPDQPIVTGCVYNGVNKPPYAPPGPGPATRSGIKTLSSKGGGGTNELYFEDKQGSEEVFLQAERNLQVKVKAARTESIGGARNTRIGSYDSTKVDDYQTLNVGTSRSVRVKGYSMNLADDFSEFGSKGSYLMLHGQTTTTVSGSERVDIAGTEIAALGYSKISLQAGGSFIVLDSSGVKISGAMVSINSGGAPLQTGTIAYSVPDNDAAGAHGTRDGSVTDPIQQLQAKALINAAQSNQALCAECQAARAAYQALMA